MIEEKYFNLLEQFHELDEEDKKSYIISHLEELLEFINEVNNNLDSSNSNLKKYHEEEEFLDLVFAHILCIKEEYAKTVKKIME